MRHAGIDMQHDAAITAQRLSVTLGGTRVLDNLSFIVPRGETTAIIGPNGAGKSVLLKVLLGLLPADSGEVSILGVTPRQLKRVASDVSYVPQRVQLDFNFPLTVRGLFSLASPGLLGMRAADRQRMQTLLRLVGVSDLAEARLSTLSGGQLQRVLIGYSLMKKPKLLILDEPSAGIDMSGQETVYSLLEHIQAEEHLTLLLVSHELDVVMRYADHVLCLNQKLLCSGVPKEALSNEMLREMYGNPVRHFHHDHDTR